MPVYFTQTGTASIRVARNGEYLSGAHAQLHTALARAAQEASRDPDAEFEVVREQRIRVSVDREIPSLADIDLDGGSAASTFDEE